MVNAVPDNEKYQAYNIYIAKVSSLLGITKTRAIFESAMQKLSEKEVLILGRKYASLEKNLGETDRARAIFTFISQSTDPKDDIKGLWAEWEAFEVECGDKETYK
jgi:pre-mRNA-splicing factor SYF1